MPLYAVVQTTTDTLHVKADNIDEVYAALERGEIDANDTENFTVDVDVILVAEDPSLSPEELERRGIPVLESTQPCSCGSTVAVTFGPDPYASEINGDYTPVWLCSSCHHERCMDI